MSNYAYRWSSYRVNAQGEADRLVAPHALYERMGYEPVERRRAYRELFRYELSAGLIDQIRSATNGNYVLGTKHFQDEVGTILGRRVTPGKAGRPKKRELE